MDATLTNIKITLILFFLLLLSKPLHAQALSIQHNPYRYDAEYSDGESRLLYLDHRYYKADTLRFISRDSYALLNRYAYANANPIMNDDPSGHDAEGAFKSAFNQANDWLGYLSPIGILLGAHAMWGLYLQAGFPGSVSSRLAWGLGVTSVATGFAALTAQLMAQYDKELSTTQQENAQHAAYWLMLTANIAGVMSEAFSCYYQKRVLSGMQSDEYQQALLSKDQVRQSWNSRRGQQPVDQAQVRRIDRNLEQYDEDITTLGLNLDPSRLTENVFTSKVSAGANDLEIIFGEPGQFITFRNPEFVNRLLNEQDFRLDVYQYIQDQIRVDPADH